MHTESHGMKGVTHGYGYYTVRRVGGMSVVRHVWRFDKFEIRLYMRTARQKGQFRAAFTAKMASIPEGIVSMISSRSDFEESGTEYGGGNKTLLEYRWKRIGGK